MKKRAIVVQGLLAALLAFSSCSSANAASKVDEEKEIGRCIGLAARGHRWLEKTLLGLRDQEGGRIGSAVANVDGTEDLGPLQVNSWWVSRMARLLGQPTQHVRYWLRYDACFNAQAANWIFLRAFGQSHDYWKAIGVYHSPSVRLQRRYAIAVAAHLENRFGQRVFHKNTIRHGAPRPGGD